MFLPNLRRRETRHSCRLTDQLFRMRQDRKRLPLKHRRRQMELRELPLFFPRLRSSIVTEHMRDQETDATA